MTGICRNSTITPILTRNHKWILRAIRSQCKIWMDLAASTHCPQRLIQNRGSKTTGLHLPALSHSLVRKSFSLFETFWPLLSLYRFSRRTKLSGSCRAWPVARQKWSRKEWSFWSFPSTACTPSFGWTDWGTQQSRENGQRTEEISTYLNYHTALTVINDYDYLRAFGKESTATFRHLHFHCLPCKSIKWIDGQSRLFGLGIVALRCGHWRGSKDERDRDLFMVLNKFKGRKW